MDAFLPIQLCMNDSSSSLKKKNIFYFFLPPDEFFNVRYSFIGKVFFHCFQFLSHHIQMPFAEYFSIIFLSFFCIILLAYFCHHFWILCGKREVMHRKRFSIEIINNMNLMKMIRICWKVRDFWKGVLNIQRLWKFMIFMILFLNSWILIISRKTFFFSMKYLKNLKLTILNFLKLKIINLLN